VRTGLDQVAKPTEKSVETAMTGGSQDGLDDRELLEELGHLSAAVGHHVINALSAIVSNAELIRSHTKAPTCDLAELAALGAAIIENALGASHVPRRLIDYTRRVTSAGFEQADEPPPLVDLNQLIAETVQSIPDEAGSPVEWVLNLNPVPSIRGNAGQLRSLLGYLIENAREAMSTGSRTVTFTTCLDPRNWVIVEIRDTGCGMSAEVLKRATEPFFSTKPGRCGAGLTIAHGIWRRHRGALSIESQPGEGTTIRLAVEPPAPSPSVETAAQFAPESAFAPAVASPESQGREPSTSQPEGVS
jgi:signal transduction histidine kinase